MSEVNGVIGKDCKDCHLWKPLDDYYGHKKAFDGRRTICKACDKERVRKYRQNNEESYKKYNRDYHEKNKDVRNQYNKRYREENKDFINFRTKRWRKANRQHISEYARHYQEQNAEKVKEQKDRWMKLNKDVLVLYSQRRRARKKLLPDDLTPSEQDLLVEQFGGCALTGDSKIHYDHVIPLSTGHGGTTFKNIIPLRGDLNISKKDKNLFEWFEANRQRFNLSQERFDRLIDWLGKVNNMSVEEYQKYVFWCHRNPKETRIEGG